MPFGDYKDFDDCISKNQDKDDPAAYCAVIKQKIEGNKEAMIIYLTSKDEGHAHSWSPSDTTTSTDDSHSHEIDEAKSMALPAGINDHTHKLLRTNKEAITQQFINQQADRLTKLRHDFLDADKKNFNKVKLGKDVDKLEKDLNAIVKQFKKQTSKESKEGQNPPSIDDMKAMIKRDVANKMKKAGSRNKAIEEVAKQYGITKDEVSSMCESLKEGAILNTKKGRLFTRKGPANQGKPTIYFVMFKDKTTADKAKSSMKNDIRQINPGNSLEIQIKDESVDKFKKLLQESVMKESKVDLDVTDFDNKVFQGYLKTNKITAKKTGSDSAIFTGDKNKLKTMIDKFWDDKDLHTLIEAFTVGDSVETRAGSGKVLQVAGNDIWIKLDQNSDFPGQAFEYSKSDVQLTESLKEVFEKEKDAVKNSKFLNLRKPLEQLGYKVDFSTSPIPFYTLTKDGKKFNIANKTYIDGADFIIGDIAFGKD